MWLKANSRNSVNELEIDERMRRTSESRRRQYTKPATNGQREVAANRWWHIRDVFSFPRYRGPGNVH